MLVPLALIFLATGLVEAWRDAPTVDEAIDIAAGVTSIVRHDLRLMPEHGVLTRVFGRFTDQPGQWHERQRGQHEQHRLVRVDEDIEEHRDRRERERGPEESSRHRSLA